MSCWRWLGQFLVAKSHLFAWAFSALIDGNLLQVFQETYCAILPMPIDEDTYQVQRISQSPLVVCWRSYDVLAQHIKTAFLHAGAALLR
jgi:hypothetical protein